MIIDHIHENVGQGCAILGSGPAQGWLWGGGSSMRLC